jgi:hypothetical protein
LVELRGCVRMVFANVAFVFDELANAIHRGSVFS